MSPTLAYLETNKTHVLILSSSSTYAPHPHACPPALSRLTFTSQSTQTSFKKKKIMYLSVPGLSCSARDSRSSLWHANSQLWHVGSSSLTRDGTRPSALGACSLSHWTSLSHREVPNPKLLRLLSQKPNEFCVTKPKGHFSVLILWSS